MVVIENLNPGQIEREKTGAGQEKMEAGQPQRIQRGCAYHAAQFHDQSTIFNTNHANAFCAGNP
jgi:hypothetical protein